MAKTQRLLYHEVYKIIATYANEVLPDFADRFERFPQGGQAAMIVNYLNDRAQFWYSIDKSVGESLANAAGEIIVRCG